jgi:membrane protease YdiL (CAAX protease family)
MKKDKLRTFLFFVITFLWTWACYVPLVITRSSPYQFPGVVLLILGGAGPSIVGVLTVLFTYSKAEKRAFWARCFDPRPIRWKAWLLIALFFPVLLAVSVAFDMLFGGNLPGMIQLKSLITNPVSIPLAALISFMSGPWSEEFGWRGVALTGLLRRFNLLVSSLILGTLWGVWHLPLYFMPDTWHGQMGFALSGFWSFMVMSVGLSLLMSLVYAHSGRSVLTGMLLHFASNFTAQLIAPSSDRVEIIRAVLLAITALVAFWIVEYRGRVKMVKPRHSELSPVVLSLL